MPNKCPEGGRWNTDSLKQYMDQQFEAIWRDHVRDLDHLRTLLDERQAANTSAITAARNALDSRFDALKPGTFMTRAEFEAQHQRLLEQVQNVTDRLNRAEGRGLGLNAGWLYLLGGLSALGTIITIITLLAHIAG